MLLAKRYGRQRIETGCPLIEGNHHKHLRPLLNEQPPLEKLWQTTLARGQQCKLFDMIDTIFKSAINARAPKMRPPGKAGLRAEKSYYRLLYLEGDFHDKICSLETTDPAAAYLNWGQMHDILHQLTDIPELLSEIMAGIESALQELNPKNS